MAVQAEQDEIMSIYDDALGDDEGMTVSEKSARILKLTGKEIERAKRQRGDRNLPLDFGKDFYNTQGDFSMISLGNSETSDARWMLKWQKITRYFNKTEIFIFSSNPFIFCISGFIAEL